MATWSEVVAALGDAVRHSDPASAEAGRLVVDPGPADLRRNDVVLAVGRNSVRAFDNLLAALPSGVASGAVVRGRDTNRARLVAAARARRLPVAVLDEHTDWIPVIERVQRVFGGAGDDTSWDLFEIADAAAAIVGGPVTIEDAAGRVVGYGGDHTDADAARVASILGRRVPAEVARQLDRSGVSGRLHAARSAFAVAAAGELAARVVAPVRTGTELIGSAWAIVPGEPPPAVLAEFARCVGLAALHLVRAANPAPPTPIDNDGFAALLYGGAGAAQAASALRLTDTGAAVAVLAVRGGDLGESTRMRARLRARLIAAAGARLTEAHVGDLNGMLCLILPADRFADGPAAAAWLDEQVLAGAGGPDIVAVAGVGQIRPATLLPQSRAHAELALAVAADEGASGTKVYDDVWATSFLRRLADLPLATELAAAGPVDVLRAHDEAGSTAYLDTLEAHLLTGGDARRAADLLHIHPNTYRYRMRRIDELVDLDLERIDIHAAVSVQLALVRARRG